jgi:hypothetical protein
MPSNFSAQYQAPKLFSPNAASDYAMAELKPADVFKLNKPVHSGLKLSP